MDIYIYIYMFEGLSLDVSRMLLFLDVCVSFNTCEVKQIRVAPVLNLAFQPTKPNLMVAFCCQYQYIICRGYTKSFSLCMHFPPLNAFINIVCVKPTRFALFYFWGLFFPFGSLPELMQWVLDPFQVRTTPLEPANAPVFLGYIEWNNIYKHCRLQYSIKPDISAGID